MQITKLFFGWLPLLLLFVLTGCDREEIDIDGNTDFPPSILSSIPAADGRVKKGDFDIKVVFADGSISPLQTATVTLMDSSMTTLKTVTKELSGIQDSLVIAAADFNSSALKVGVYNMKVSVTDSKGQTTEQTFTFQISNNEFAANYDEIYIAGAFSGWDGGSMPLTLVSANTWEIQGVDLKAGAWKLLDSDKFGGEDWGDPDCDGFMNSNKGSGGGDTACGSSGLVNIRFNDNTLSYSVTPQVTFASKTMGLYLLGSFNDFSGSDNQFILTGDNTWELAEVQLVPGDQFKFAEMPDFQGINYGDNDMDGVAQVGGSNITLADTLAKGIYRIDFNDRTLAYSVTYLGPTYSSIGIIGNATPGGWDSDTNMTENEDGSYTIIIGLGAGEVKFRADDEFTDDWGGTEFPSGTAVYKGGNIAVTPGIYLVTFNPEALTYSFEVVSIGLIGDSTPGGWVTDTDMTANPAVPGEVSVKITLGEGKAKFRANDEFVYDWGSTEFPAGTATFKGGDIPVVPGEYTVTFNVNTLAYSFVK